MGPFPPQAGAGFASAVFLLARSLRLINKVCSGLRWRRPLKDEPVCNTPRRQRLVSLSSGAGDNQIGEFSGPVVVEAYVNGDGEMYDYRIVSGPNDAATRSQIENLLLTSRFEPARFFGQPVRGLAVLSFSGVSVRG